MADPPPSAAPPSDLLLAWRSPPAGPRSRDGSTPPSTLWFLFGLGLCFCALWVPMGFIAAMQSTPTARVALLPLSVALPLLLPPLFIALRLSDPLKPRRDRAVGPTLLLNRTPGLREWLLARLARIAARATMVSADPEQRIWALNDSPPRLISACCGDPEEQAQLIRLSDKPPLVQGFWIRGSDPLLDVPLPSPAVLPSGCGTVFGFTVALAAMAGFISLGIWISAGFVLAATVCFLVSAAARPSNSTHGQVTLYRFAHDTTDSVIDLSTPTRAWNWASVGWNPPCWVAVKAGGTPPLVPIEQATLLFVYLPEQSTRQRSST
jgi:hypothetical protein